MLEGEISGNEPLREGMALSVRMRRDFTVTDPARLLRAARVAYRQLNPDATAQDAAEAVTSAVEALYTVLEHAGLIGDEVDERLAGWTDAGLAVEGWQAEAFTDEPVPLPAGWRCFDLGDVFALPAAGGLPVAGND